MEMPANPPETNEILLPREGQLDFILGRIDLVAIVITLLGVCLLGVVAMVLAVIELAKLVANLWSNPIDRWAMIILGAAIVWVVVRWKKSCV